MEKDESIKFSNFKNEAVFKYDIDHNAVFLIKDKEMLRINVNGDFYVKEKLCTNDMDSYKSFKFWIDYIIKNTMTLQDKK